MFPWPPPIGLLACEWFVDVDQFPLEDVAFPLNVLGAGCSTTIRVDRWSSTIGPIFDGKPQDRGLDWPPSKRKENQ